MFGAAGALDPSISIAVCHASRVAQDLQRVGLCALSPQKLKNCLIEVCRKSKVLGVKYTLLILPILLLSGCARAEGSLLIGGEVRNYLPQDVPSGALNAVINYVNSAWASAHISGSNPVSITGISTEENSAAEIKLRVITSTSSVLFTLQPIDSIWSVVAAQ